MMDWLRTLLFLPRAATDVAAEIDALHFFVVGVTFAGSFGVLAATAYFMLRWRRRSEADHTPRVQASRAFEVLVIGGLLSLFLLWWVLGYQQYIAIRTPPENTFDVHVSGKQWMWKFTYPDGRTTAGVLVVPAREDVKLLISARDVVHGFYVPDFRLKQDAVPGHVFQAWFRTEEAGTHDVYCAEYCGRDHSKMEAKVVALGEADFRRWLDGELPDPVARAALRLGDDANPVRETGANLAERGERIAAEFECLACHSVDGQEHVGPTWRGLYGRSVRLTSGEVVRADEAYLTRSMMDPMVEQVAGYESVMPTYQGILDAAEAAAVVAYIKTLDESAEPIVPLPRVRVERLDAGTAEAEQDVEPVAPAHEPEADPTARDGEPASAAPRSDL